MIKYFLTPIFIIMLYACESNRSDSIFTNAQYGAVVSAHPMATQVGMDILKAGGNAFDAAIAVHMSLAVVYPRAGNIAGGGFMVYHDAQGNEGSLDFREKASRHASRDMYLDEEGMPIEGMSRLGAMSVAVPGSVAGMEAIHQRFSILSWEELMQPSIQQARKGIELTQREADVLNRYQKEFIEQNGNNHFFVNEEGWKAGDELVFSDLARTLEIISLKGKAGFYKGVTADNIVKTIQEKGGLLDHEDLENYEVKWRDPLVFDYEDYTIVSMSMPSSGGISLLQLFHGFEQWNGDEQAMNSSAYLHLNTELQRRVYADRAEYLGDLDFVEVPLEKLRNENYLDEKFSDIQLDHATPSSAIKEGSVEQIESVETTHISVIDQWGNAVSITSTLNGNFGSKLMCKGSGFMLNNQMDDFSIKPGYPNQFGLVGNEENSIEANKRMLSSMTPTIVLQGEDVQLILGTPGGSTIITSVFQVILNALIYDLPAQEAVNAPKFHSQWLPDELYYEEHRAHPLLLDSLSALGHVLQSKPRLGKLKLIRVDQGLLSAAGDTLRGDDKAMVE